MIQHFLAAFGDSFSLDRELGVGPFSRSYLVIEKESKALRYLSILPAELSPDPSRANHFLEVLKDYCSVSSAFLQVDEGGFLARDFFYSLSSKLSSGVVPVQEYFRPESLFPQSISQVGAACCRALTVLHAAGKVHGGIVPASLIVCDGEIRISDTGILGALREAGVQTQNFQFLEMRYFSPEQTLRGEATAQSDIYSLGAILYHLLTGKPPFGGRTTAALLASVLIDETVADALTGGQEPGHVASAVLRAIEKSPSDRWISAQRFGDALQRASPGSGPQVRPSNRVRRPGCLPSVALLSAISAYALYRFLER